MPMSDDEIRKRYAAMFVAELSFMADAYWEEREKYAVRRTREQLDALLHYGHVIPLSRGFTDRYVTKNYPGWTWNQLVRVLTAAGVFVNRGGSPPICDAGVREVYFDSERGWLVAWANGRLTAGVAPPGSSEPQPSGNPLPAIDLETGEQLEG